MKYFLGFLLSFSVLGQDIIYTIVGPTNTITWTSTNVPAPVGFALYLTTSAPAPGSAAARRLAVPSNAVLCSTLFAGASNTLYNLTITAILPNGIETQHSTNMFLYWVPPPAIIPSGVGSIIVR